MAACWTLSAFVAAFPARSDTDSSVYTLVDPDGVPLSLSQPGVLTPALAAAERRAQASATGAPQDQDWLVHGYEQQLLSHPGQAGDANLYLELSSNKTLAEIAGLAPIDAGDPTAHASSNASGAPANPDRAGTGTTNASGPATGAFQWRPLITPIGSAGLLGAENFSAPGLLTTFSPFSPDQPQQQAPPVRTSPDVDASMLETPGLVAAAKDGTFDDSGPDLSLDLLPGESPAEAMQRQGQARLDPPTNADELHQQEADQLSPPKPPTVAGANSKDQQKKPDTTPPPPPDDTTPTPVTKLQPISPVRSPIASPYSILNR